jgi:hypothetical protein
VTLEDFVRDSLVQIVRGAKAAHEEIGGHGGAVNPKPNQRIPEESGGYWSGSTPVYPVDFDVAVTASEESGAQGKVGVVAGVLGLAGGISETDALSRVSRLKFRLYMSLPVVPPAEDDRKPAAARQAQRSDYPTRG